jgi:hypothetical protein
MYLPSQITINDNSKKTVLLFHRYRILYINFEISVHYVANKLIFKCNAPKINIM